MNTRAVALFLALCLFFVTSRAYARCDDAAREWVQTCASEQHVELSLSDCPSGVALLESRAPGGVPLRVELSHGSQGFVRVGEVSISPVGSFADWAKEPESTRRAFDAVVACARARPPTPLLSNAAARVRPVQTRAFPWLLVVGGVLAVASRLTCRQRSLLLVVGGSIGSALACFAVRRWLTSVHFFHQNGQAPLWIEFAISGDRARYGPGYGEIFQPWLAGAARPDLRLMLVQEVASAFTPACAFAVARFVSAPRALAVVCGIAVALDPMAMRLARSESYFATILTLLMLAAATLAVRVRRPNAPFLLAAAASGCFVAAAARVHPLAWVPAATLPLVILAARGPTPRLLKQTLLYAVIVGVIVAVAVLPTMRSVLGGDLGGRFLPSVRAMLQRGWVWFAAAFAVSAATLAAPATRRVGRRLVSVALVVALAILSNIVSIDTGMIASAYEHLFLPAALAGGIALTGLAPTRIAVVAATLIFVLHAARDRRVLIEPTDAREQSWCLTWRESLPRGSTVMWVERAGLRVLALPLSNVGLTPMPIHLDEVPRPPAAGARFYYRSSLCSTPDGAELCARFERPLRLRSLERRVLPAIPSQPWNTYPVAEITVELFAVE